MANTGIVKKIFGKYPIVEILARHIYWKNIRFLIKYISKKKDEQEGPIPLKAKSMDLLFEQWRSWGIISGDFLILTSSYKNLGDYQLEPFQIIDRIIEFLGPEGTLAMPAFPHFRNTPKKQDYLSEKFNSEVYEYNATKNFVTTGLLPGTLIKYKGAVRSSFPINTIVAYGKYAAQMFVDEWRGKDPLPCGKGSGWEFAARKNAKIVSLGTDLTHSLTMIHVAEDLNPNWPVLNWYRNKKFILIERNIIREVLLKERDPKWGTLYFAERKLCSDLLSNGIMKSEIVDGILTEKVDSEPLLNYLNSKNQNGYPYYCIPAKSKRNR